jgi:hypothetical protein
MSDSKWYRVVDPLSPLFGCDVSGRLTVGGWDIERDRYRGYLIIESMRRIDVFVGDRPFQLVAPKGDSLGLIIRQEQLEISPLQVDVVEIDSKRPFGICLDESEMQRADGLVLHVVNYEQATQVALKAGDGGQLLATQTFADKTKVEQILTMFERGDDQDDIVYMLKRNN